MAVVSFKLFSFYFSLFLSQASALRIYTYPYCADDKGNYTQNSTYYNNLKTVLSNLSSNTEITYGFYNFSYGHNTDKAYAIGLCRGDVNPKDCRNCLEEISADLITKCPNKKEAMSRLDKCILRYSNRSIFGVMESEPWLLLCNTNNAILDAERFNQTLEKMFDGLRKTVLLGDSRRKYAATHVTGPKLQDDIYGLIQCTPDLSSQQCDECLSLAFADLRTCTNDTRVGGTIIKPSCNVRYEKYQFLESTAPPPSSPPLSPPSSPPLSPPSSPPSGFTNNTSSKGKGNTSRTAIIIAVPIVVVVLVLCFIYIYLRVKKPREIIKNPSEDDQIETNESLHFNFDIIRVATNDFSDSNKLGQGGFGVVYWGKLPSGQAIAVKRLCTTSAQGDLEFKNEVLLVAKLQHRNLVRLLGFNLEGRERLLVYEFVPNKSLDYFIFDPTKKAQLDWEKRYKIIGGIARGLLYLHEDSRLRIIHRDLKASNILLDEQMNPKISDFGMARLIVVDQTQANTSRIVGTYGYMAPEYVMHGQYSVKSDVFSFGVLVLEIVSGQKNSGICSGEDVEDLLSFAWRNWREGTVASIIDPSVCNNSRNEIMRCIHISLLCVQDNVSNRPTMATIVLMLNSDSLSLPIPSEPAFFMDSRTRSLLMQSWQDNNSRTITRSSESTTKSTIESVYEASITDPYPR